MEEGSNCEVLSATSGHEEHENSMDCDLHESSQENTLEQLDCIKRVAGLLVDLGREPGTTDASKSLPRSELEASSIDREYDRAKLLAHIEGDVSLKV